MALTRSSVDRRGRRKIVRIHAINYGAEVWSSSVIPIMKILSPQVKPLLAIKVGETRLA
jgi:hypothetical protein